MGDTIQIVVTGDAKKLTDELKRAGVEFKRFGDEAKKSGDGAKALGGSMKGLAAELGLLYGLGQVVTMVADFGKASFESAAQAERLGRATGNMAKTLGESGDAMVAAITGASQETISQLDAMQAANKAMMFGLVENSGQMADLTKVAVTLGQAMGQDAATSIDDLTTALGRQSPMILDNLGITLKLEEAYQIYAASLGKTASELTEAEKKQAFVNAALEKGKAKVEELGGITVDAAGRTEQLAAAWSDFQVAFGGLLTQFSEGGDVLVDFIRNLEDGALAWQGISDQMSVVAPVFDSVQQSASGLSQVLSVLNPALTLLQVDTTALLTALNPAAGVISATKASTETLETALTGAAHWVIENTTGWEALADAHQASAKAAEQTNRVTQSQIQIQQAAAGVAHLQAQAAEDAAKAEQAKSAETARWAGLATTSKQKLDELARGHTMTAAEVEAYTEAQKAAIEAEERRQELLGAAAGYFNSLTELQNQAVANEQAYAAQVGAAREEAAASQEEKAKDLNEKLSQLEQERAEKIAWVQSGAHARTAADNEAALAHWNSHYDQLIATAQGKAAEETAAIEAERAKREANAAAARAKEQAEYQAHLEELKLKTALSLLETTGQLEQMTGLIGVSASEAAELIKAGLLPVTNELGQAIQGTMGELASKQEEAAATAEKNQDTLKQAFEGSLPAIESQADALGVKLPEAMASGAAGMADFSGKTQAEFDKATGQIKKFGEEIKKQDWPGIGRAVVQGISVGIEKNQHLVLEKLKALARDAIAAAKSELGIQSPSRVFAELGAEIPAGAALGVQQGSSLFDRALEGMFGGKRLDGPMQIINMAREEIDDWFEGFLDNAEAELAEKRIVSLFTKYRQEILSASDPLAKFMELNKKFGGAIPTMNGAGQDLPFQAFLKAYERAVPQAQAAQLEKQLADMSKIGSIGAGFGSFASATGNRIKDQLETQLKFVRSKEEQLRLEQQVLGVEQDLATVAGQTAQFQEMQKTAGRLDYARKNRLDPASVLALSGDDFGYLQQQLGFQDMLRKSGLGKFAGDFGLGSGLFDMFGAAGGGLGSLLGQYGRELGSVAPRGGSGQQIHFHLNVDSSMPSAGLVRDFRLMQSMAGG